MTTLPHSPHVARKRGYAPHYSPANLASFQPEIHQYTFELIDVCLVNNIWPNKMTDVPQILHRFSGRTALDSLVLFRQLMVDILSASSFGYRVGALSKWNIVNQDTLAMAIVDFPKRGILVVLPSICMCSSDLVMTPRSVAPSLLGPGIWSVVFQTAAGANYVILTRSWPR